MSPRQPTPEKDEKSSKDPAKRPGDDRGIVYHGHDWETDGEGDGDGEAEEHERGVVQNERDKDGDGDEDRDFDNEVTQPGRG